MRKFLLLIPAVVFTQAFTAGAESYISISYENFSAKALKVLIPLVEEVCGEKFLYEPQVEIGSSYSTSEVIKRENENISKRLSKFLAKSEKEFYRKNSNFDVYKLLAKYSFLDKKIIILPENLGRNEHWRNLTIKEEQELFTLVMFHELTHALCDQRYKLFDYMEQVKTVDELQALNACIEGYAVFFTRKASAKLGYGSPKYTHILDGRFEFAVEKPEDMVTKLNAELLNFYYSDGAKFFEYVYSKGGSSEVKKIMRRPPRCSSVILNPGKRYSKKPKSSISLNKVVGGVKEIPIFSDWEYIEKKFGDALFKSISISDGFKEADINNLMPSYVDGAQSAWHQEGKSFFINVLAFKDAQSAAKFVELDRINLKALSAADMISLQNTESANLENTDYSWNDEYSFLVMFKKNNLAVTGFRKDFLVVEVQCLNSPELNGHKGLVLKKIIGNILKHN